MHATGTRAEMRLLQLECLECPSAQCMAGMLVCTAFNYFRVSPPKMVVYSRGRLPVDVTTPKKGQINRGYSISVCARPPCARWERQPLCAFQLFRGFTPKKGQINQGYSISACARPPCARWQRQPLCRYLRFFSDGTLLMRTSPDPLKRVWQSLHRMPHYIERKDSRLPGRWKLQARPAPPCMRCMHCTA